MIKRNGEIEQYRIKEGALDSDATDGNNGAFLLDTKTLLAAIISDGGGWDHISVSLPERCPTWDEMCLVKRLFFSSNEVAIQYHPAEDDYINYHPFCLHLWRPHGITIPTPPLNMIAPTRRQNHEPEQKRNPILHHPCTHQRQEDPGNHPRK